MRWSKLLFLLVLIVLLENVKSKGGRGGGRGGFKLFGFKKSKAKQQKTAMRAPAAPTNEISKNNKYFNRESPITSKDYGAIFASRGLSSNSYIYNNYYRTHSRQAGIAQFLTNALFLRAGMRIGGLQMSQYDEWNEDDDKRWRMTTKAPYFENKIPGEIFFFRMKSS